MKKLFEVIDSIRFYFPEVDADLNVAEFLAASCLGISIVVVPLLIKMLLLWLT